MKELLANMKKLEEELNIVEEAWDARPESEELEKAYDAAYEKWYRVYEAAANWIVKFTGNRVDFKTAKAMIAKHSNTIETLIEGMA